MNEKIKETVATVAQVACPTFGILGLLAVVLAGVGLSMASLFGMLFFYEPAFFGFTFAIGFLVAVFGTLQLSGKFFELGKHDSE